MALWMVRAGSHGEHEDRFLDENRIYVTWDGLSEDLSGLPDREAQLDVLKERMPDAKLNTLRNHASQLWPFAHDMEKGDLVILPSKSNPVIHVGEITGTL